jgi:mono/diheme cytochrome c family protein
MNMSPITRALLLTSLLAMPMGLAAQHAGHDDHGHGDHGAQQAQPQSDHEGHGDHQGHAGQEAVDGQADHGGHDAHAGHDMGPGVTRGSWSYLDRDNPVPHDGGRWVMVPMPGVQAGYRFVRSVDESDVCAGLDERRVMVDRATREACASRPAAMPFPGVAMAADTDGHEGHGDHQGHGDHGANMGLGEHNTPEGHDAPGGHEGHGDHMSPGGHNTHEGHDMPGGHEGHEDHGAHGSDGGHDRNASDHGWHAPPKAVAMANPVPATRESVRRGQAVYQAFCMSCHGASARGNGPEANGLDTPPADLMAHLSHHSDGDYAWKIRTGNSPMPAFGEELTDREIWDVVNYLRDLAPGRQSAHYQAR